MVTFGCVLFVDATHGTSHYDWPLFTPCVLNSDQKIRPIGYCLVDSECDLSQAWMLTSMLEIEPGWRDVVQVIFTDDKLSHESVTAILPHVTLFLCWWHLVYRDLENVRNCGRLTELPEIRDFIVNEFVYGVSADHIEIKWEEFQNRFPGKATQYMTNWIQRRHKWCSPWWSAIFTCGRTSNASAEANNAALKVAYEVGTDTLCRLIMQTCERSSALKAQDLIASDHNYLQSCSAVSSLSECDLLSYAAQILECRAHFASHVGDSLERTIARYISVTLSCYQTVMQSYYLPASVKPSPIYADHQVQRLRCELYIRKHLCYNKGWIRYCPYSGQDTIYCEPGCHVW